MILALYPEQKQKLERQPRLPAKLHQMVGESKLKWDDLNLFTSDSSERGVEGKSQNVAEQTSTTLRLKKIHAFHTVYLV